VFFYGTLIALAISAMRVRLSSLAVLCMVAVAATTTATEFDAFDRQLQVDGSDVIIVGRIVSVRSAWSGDHSAILTTAAVAVDDAWKGPCADRIEVRTFGGRVGNVALEVEGAARFEAGERVVLFLRRVGDAYSPFGMRFGKFDVVGSGAAAVVVGEVPPTRRGEHQTATLSTSLAAFRAEVAGLVREEKP
jgi:hypothetical protein